MRRMSDLRRELHELEQEFGLRAADILDIINRRNRCKIAVRGAIAEAHLLRHPADLQARGVIERFEDYDIDGHPDCRVWHRNRAFLLECKNVRKERLVDGAPTIDLQRTRNPIGKPWERYYLPDEFQIVAACLWNRTRSWEFRFAATKQLPRHSQYSDRLSTVRVVSDASGPWTPDLSEVLERL